MRNSWLQPGPTDVHPWGLGTWESAFSKSPGGFGAASCHSEPLTPGEVQRVEYYFAEGSGGRNQSAAIIYQQNAINMICQNGPNSHIAIGNAKAIQIGHGNVMARQSDHGESAGRGQETLWGQLLPRAGAGMMGVRPSEEKGAFRSQGLLGGLPENEDSFLRARIGPVLPAHLTF